MKRQAMFLLSGLLIANISFAQVTSSSRLTLSEEMKEPAGTTISDYLGGDESNFYVLRKKVQGAGFGTVFTSFSPSQGWVLESYGNDLSMKKQQEIEPVINGEKTYLDNIKYLDGNLYAFISYVNKKGDQTELYYQSIEKKTLMLTGSPKKIAFIPYDSKFKQGDFTYEESRDKKAIAIIASLYDEKNANEQFKVSVFDKDMNKLWQKDITLPYDSKLFEKEELLLDNNGNIYLSGRLYKEKAKEKRKGVANYSYLILAYRDKGESAKEYTVSLKNEFITDLGFNITSDDKLAVAGFYSSQGTYSIKGVCFTLIDAASGGVLRQGSESFDAAFMDIFSSQQVDKKDQELYRYSLDNIIIRSDGGVLLLAEQYYVREVTSYSQSGTGGTTSRTTYYYYYNDVIAVNVNPDMTIEWATKVPKRQVTSNDGGYYSSYAYAVAGDKIYLLFNDNPDNLTVTDPSKLAKYSGVKKSVATLVTISSDGKWKKGLLFSNKTQGEILRPKICEQSAPNRFFLYAEKGKSYVVGKAEL